MESVFAHVRDEMFDHILVRAHFTDRLVGGCPKDPKLIQAWIRKGMGLSDQEELFSRARQHLLEMVGTDDEARAQITDAMSAEELFAISEKVAGEVQTQGFKRYRDDGPYIEARQIKAGIKESVNILYAGEKWGKITKEKGSDGASYQGKGPKGYTAERVYALPNRIACGTAANVLVDMNIGHIYGAQGPQSTVGYYEYVERQQIEFLIFQLKNPKVGGKNEPALDDVQWSQVFTHMELNGLGAMRSQGFGQFVTAEFGHVSGAEARAFLSGLPNEGDGDTIARLAA